MHSDERERENKLKLEQYENGFMVTIHKSSQGRINLENLERPVRATRFQNLFQIATAFRCSKYLPFAGNHFRCASALRTANPPRNHRQTIYSVQIWLERIWIRFKHTKYCGIARFACSLSALCVVNCFAQHMDLAYHLFIHLFNFIWSSWRHVRGVYTVICAVVILFSLCLLLVLLLFPFFLLQIARWGVFETTTIECEFYFSPEFSPIYWHDVIEFKSQT